MAAEEWGKSLQLRIASLDLKQAPKLLWEKGRREEGGHELSTGLDGGEEEGMRVS